MTWPERDPSVVQPAVTTAARPGDPAGARAGAGTVDALPEPVRARLPGAYLLTLRCIAVGATDGEIAAQVGVDESAVRSLVRLATAKLLQIQAELAVAAAPVESDPPASQDRPESGQ